MKQGFRYFAFISYEQSDEQRAEWLRRKLENSRLVDVLRKEKDSLPRKMRIFREKADNRDGSLSLSVREELKESGYLIVVCSPCAIYSERIEKEIDDFIALGGQDRIILFNAERAFSGKYSHLECYPSVIREKLPEIWKESAGEKSNGWKWIKKQKAFVNVLSRLTGVEPDKLWKRYKRRIIFRRILLFAGIVMISGALGAVWQVNKPFDIRLQIAEKGMRIMELPFQKGTVSLFTGKDTITRPIHAYGEIIEFNGIPAKLKGEKKRICFRMPGYEKTETVLPLEPEMFLSVRRDSTYARVRGYVRNSLTNETERGVKVMIEGQSVMTDGNGYFSLSVPLKRQKASYNALLVWKGRVSKIQTVYPTQNKDSLFNTLYVK